MVILIKNLVSSCDTNEQGEAVLRTIIREIDRNDSVVLDFTGVLYATSSFVNSAFVPLLERMTFETIKRKVRVTKALPAVADMIRRRMARESELSAA